ncbi:papain-like cysteine protease family protein [Paenibacillus sp. L3-i20]|uniref:papain-like cysteine protease family protein n=1 Tax=Paenibacillus sp. L3-i20 TaxID=2905833 RepID=UPI001EE08A84|nr:papain-like cysteine protease family protein [Paenibacillus sp. L3-i20]GKU75989.1 hypothetical protein L3i20_v203860 [Paenibacillus sp. L3-i20]
MSHTSYKVYLQLNKKKPIGVTYPNNDGHALVIYGYYQDTNSSKEDVYFIDPSNKSKKILSYSNFVSNAGFTWASTVQNIY